MSLRARLQALIERTELRGEEFCRAYADAADEWLTDLFDKATDGDTKGLALVAVGGYGRSELCPFSDLDVVLVHKGKRNISAMADRIWYPVWDEGISLDHSVRRPNDVLAMASEDLRVALGLLDARVVCGDAKVAEPVISGSQERWARQKPPWLGVLADLVDERHRSYGDVGFLIEPDVKEAHGGLRDVAALEAMMLAVPVLADYVDTVALGNSRAALTAIRVELHRKSGREQNRLLLQEQDQVAVALDRPDTDTLLRELATAGRTIAWESDDAWRRRGAWSKANTGRRRDRSGSREDGPVPGFRGIGITEGEVALLADAEVATDPSLSLRLAAVAADRNLPIARNALNLLGRKAPAPETPWTDVLRSELVRVLATGPPAINALEALDQRRLLERFFPEWASVRNKPQRNPYHRFTVDRHLLEATANAALLAHRVSRPDLLLVGTLLHDIGKGSTGDHTDVGITMVTEIGERMGYPPEDVAILVSLVRLHLLLPDSATRRDLDDPSTARQVAEAVGNRTTLDLLAALVEADSLATGPSAWGSWKAGLVADLVERTGRLLAGEPAAAPTPWITDSLRSTMDEVRERGAPVLSIEEPMVTVVAPDRSGLLAEVTGILAIHGLNVRTAVVAEEEGIAAELFTVEPSRGRWPQAERLTADLVALSEGSLSIDAKLAERARAYRKDRRAVRPQLVSTRVTVDNNASAIATVVEVRAEDVVGQLHRITQALVDCSLDVTSAKVSTFGAAVVDAFYVRGPGGDKVTDPTTIAAIEDVIVERLSHPIGV